MTKPPPLLRLRVTTAAETALRSGHPWLFAESIQEQSRPGRIGELAVVYDRRNRFLALGLLDPASPIRLRVLHFGKVQTLDDDWWRARLNKALAFRRSMFDAQTTGYRWINGESDGWPGLVLDRYDTTLVLKVYTVAWLPRLDFLRDLIVSQLRPERIVLRLSRNIQNIARSDFGTTDGGTLLGTAPAGPVEFLESGLRFEADVVRGQKTGFFLDQRENRRRAGAIARGKRVLNVFSYSGGFSVYAAGGGARSTTDLDISAHALATAKRNFRLNNSHPAAASCAYHQAQADAFDWLAAEKKRKFDLLILDPPSMAKRESERPLALNAYVRLTGSALRLLAHGGILVACSCSAHVPGSEFFDAVRGSAAQTRRRFAELEITGQPSDHPASFPEAYYLKAIYLRFD